MFGHSRDTEGVASTGTLAVAVGSTAAAISFAVVTLIGSAPPRSDLGGPVVVETGIVPEPALSGPLPGGNDGGRN